MDVKVASTLGWPQTATQKVSARIIFISAVFCKANVTSLRPLAVFDSFVWAVGPAQKMSTARFTP